MVMGLSVYLYGRKIGRLEPATATDYTFEYDDSIVKEVETGTVVLSQALPVQREAYDPLATRCYFEGLLPESSRREELARELRVSVNDSYALLARIGRDCAGAVVILPEGEMLGGDAKADVEWLSAGRLAELVEELPRKPLGISRASGKLRLSLAGVQRKLALVRGEDGRFGEPIGEMPSTHLIKPEYGEEVSDLAVNEMFCMTVAAGIGLPTATTELTSIAGRRCLVSSRFDRVKGAAGSSRLHQEDLCQALGIPANLKYEANSGPGFRHFRRLLAQIGRGGDLRTMVRAAVLNLVLGNSDAHGKNFAILFTPEGRRLAPLYDLVSTAVYDFDRDMAMAIGDNFDPDSVRLEDWLDMSADCELAPGRLFTMARTTAAEVVTEVTAAKRRAEEEEWHSPVIDAIAEVVRERAGRIQKEIDDRAEDAA
ncbi:MAG TPA: HipA domain-containing protein [Solirubrobacterales bacterium]|nr:HipA domain-containing protein [Solirubrobacterales bacterium]